MMQAKTKPPRYENCGESSNVVCATCNRNICKECTYYGDAGKLCGLCYNKEVGYKRYRLWLSTRPRPVLSFNDWYYVNA